MLTGYIRGQELRISTPEIAADSIKYLEAEFHFAGRDWDGYVKTAYFINGASKFALGRWRRVYYQREPRKQS